MLSLEELISAMEMQTEMMVTFVNKKTSEIVSVRERILRKVRDEGIEPPYENYADWETEEIELCEDIAYNQDYIRIPSRHDIHEWEIMREFCFTIEDEEIMENMLTAIKGSGAFRRFKDKIYEFNISDEWYKYKKKSFKEIAINWCERNNIEYEDDLEE